MRRGPLRPLRPPEGHRRLLPLAADRRRHGGSNDGHDANNEEDKRSRPCCRCCCRYCVRPGGGERGGEGEGERVADTWKGIRERE